MKEKRRKKWSSSLSGALILFASITVMVSIVVLVYTYAEHACGGNKGILAVVMFCVILVFAAVCTGVDYVRRKYTVDEPVRKILEATDLIASGDFSVCLQPTHSLRRFDEYDFIMENFNKMAAELSHTEVLHGDFISNVSHELKTPLAVIRNYAAALQNGVSDEATRMQYLQTISSAADKLTALVSNILKLNKLENREISPEYETFDLGESIAQSVIGLDELIEKKNLRLDCDLEENVTVSSVPQYLDIVWNNLLSNAIKFTDEGGEIGVSLHVQDGRAVVRVSDSGCGISSEVGKRIFEKFYQGDTSHAQEGNGLGLALVKKVIDIVGGEIQVSSELGKGTVFTVVLAVQAKP